MRKKWFGLLFLLFIIFGLSLSVSSDTSAATHNISRILASQSIFTKNFESSKITQTLNSQNVPATVLATDSNLTGFWDYVLAFSFTNPATDHSGTGYNHSIYFTISSDYNIANTDLPNLLGNVSLTFEGISPNQNYCTSGYDIVAISSNSVRYRITSSCPYGSFPTSQNFQTVLALVNYTPDSIFWCANDSSRTCPTSPIYITLSNIYYDFELLSTAQDSYNQTIINQNQQIINQNQQIIEQDNQDRSDLNNQVDDTGDSADSAASQITSGITPITTLIANYVNIILHPPQKDCSVNMNILFQPFHNGQYGSVDLCSLDPPAAISIIGTLIIIGFTVPFAYSIFMFILKEMQNFVEGS